MNKEFIKNNYMFHYSNGGVEKFFCTCGEHFKVEKPLEEKEFTLKISNNRFYKNLDLNLDELMGEITIDENCPNCEKSTKDFYEKGLCIITNKKFYKKFVFEENSENIYLHKILFEGDYNSVDESFEINETKNSIGINKKTKEIFLINSKNEEQILELNNIFNTVYNFYNSKSIASEIKIVDNLLDIHIFTGRLSNFIRDAKNIDFVSGLMEDINGTRNKRINDSLPVLTKVTSILLSITKYEPLSTIALTKNGAFLFELLKDCKLPNSKGLLEKNITKPLSLFSYLINLEEQEVQEKIDREDSEKQKYLFKSVTLIDGREIKIENKNDNFDDSKIRKSEDGTLILKEDLIEKQISPFIYKKITSVKQYKKIIRYKKFIDYNYLVNLCKKYDFDFLTELYDYLEFRGDMNVSRLNYFLKLYTNYKEEDYVLQFEFRHYVSLFDDCIRMIHSLKWDINKHLLNIKKCSEIEKYHDWLVKHYNVTQQKETNIKYQEFVGRYKNLEEYVNDDVRVKLIDTVEGLMFWAKELNNCAASYVKRVIDEQYVLAIAEYKTYKKDEEKDNLKNFMLGLKVDKRGFLEFDALKSTNNYLASDKFKKIIMDYLREKDISFREVADLYIEKIDNNSENETFDFVHGI